jgi:type I restriction enzyme S subunit
MTWKKVKLKTLLSQPVQNGYSPVCPETPNGRWVLGLGALNGSGLDVTQMKPAPINDKKVDDFLLQPGDFLVSRSNTVAKVGRSALVRKEIVNCSYPDLMMRFRVDSSRIYPEFLEMYLRGIEATRHFQRSASGTSESMVKINKSVVESLLVPTPPFPEQVAIAELLSTWDASIEKTERLIAAKERWFEGLVNRLIVTSARLNKDWKHLRIRDIADRVQRRSNGEEHPILTIASASGFVLQEEKYSRYMAGESVKNYILIRRGEFAYNKGNSLRYQFGCIFELKAYEEALVPHVYVCFRLREGVVPSYLGHLFGADYLKPQLGAIVKTGVRNNGLLNIRPDEFMNVTVPIPPLDQQQQIAATLNTARQEIDLLKKQAEAYRRQKRGMMQKLLTGEWRVRVGGGDTDEHGRSGTHTD